MSFSYKFRTLRSWNSYGSGIQPEVSAQEDEATGEVETGIEESNEENSARFFPDLVDERKKANLEPLDAQINALSEMMDSLIKSNSPKEPTTANSRGTRHQYQSRHCEIRGSSGFRTVAPRTTAWHSPDNEDSVGDLECSKVKFLCLVCKKIDWHLVNFYWP